MALVLADRVKETTNTTGTGTLTLAGASIGYQPFSVIGNGNSTYYSIISGNDWEVGIGTYTLSGTTLSRDTVTDSSSGGSKISVAAGAEVFITFPAYGIPNSLIHIGSTAPANTNVLWLDESDPNGVGMQGVPSGGNTGQEVCKVYLLVGILGRY